MAKIYIGDLDNAAVLAALCNNARLEGPEALHPPEDFVPISIEQAQSLLDTPLPNYPFLKPGEFKIVCGRFLMVNLRDEEEFESWGYDRHNGPGQAKRVVNHLRETGSIEKIN